MLFEVTESLIWAVATGHGPPRVKRIMEEAGLVEPMEPLWHAVREELGEELEPLPAEIRDTVTEIRQEFTEKNDVEYDTMNPVALPQPPSTPLSEEPTPSVTA